VELHYETFGEGEPLLLLHGMGGAGSDWEHAGRADFAAKYRLIVPDLRGHGRSTGRFEGHLVHSLDVEELLDRLAIARCRAVGMSMGGNTLLHLASREPERVEAMVVVSATPHFPEQARAIMRQVPQDSGQPESEWAVMRERHTGGDEQIRAIWQAMRDLGDSRDDMNLGATELARIRSRTLVVYGDRDPLYPVEIGVELYRSIPRASLMVIPGGGHGPIFEGQAPAFVRAALDFLSAARPQ